MNRWKESWFWKSIESIWRRLKHDSRTASNANASFIIVSWYVKSLGALVLKQGTKLSTFYQKESKIYMSELVLYLLKSTDWNDTVASCWTPEYTIPQTLTNFFQHHGVSLFVSIKVCNSWLLSRKRQANK